MILAYTCVKPLVRLHVGQRVGPFWGPFGVHFWVHLGVHIGVHFWVHFGNMLGTCWEHFGNMLGTFWMLMHLLSISVWKSVLRQESSSEQEYSSNKISSSACKENVRAKGTKVSERSDLRRGFGTAFGDTRENAYW